MSIDYKKELEDFIYIVSHDLNAPLRHIREFGKLLAKKMDDRLSEEEKEYLFYMQDGVNKAETMLGGLLQCSRLSTQAEEHSEFSADEAARQALESLQSSVDKEQAKVSISALPDKISGDEKQIEQLFALLLKNTLKFKKEDTAPVVTVSAQEGDDHWQFCVEDNGIGIDEAQHERVFTMFRRLNIHEENPGAGIGLTLAKKIVESHDGKIWIESELEQGTRIFFTLPK